MAAGQALDFCERSVNRLRVERAPAFEERLLVAEVAVLRAAAGDDDRIGDEIEVVLDEVAADRRQAAEVLLRRRGDGQDGADREDGREDRSGGRKDCPCIREDRSGVEKDYSSCGHGHALRFGLDLPRERFARYFQDRWAVAKSLHKTQVNRARPPQVNRRKLAPDVVAAGIAPFGSPRARAGGN